MDAQKQGIELRQMTIDELKAAIQRPLQARFPNGEKRFEPALVDKLARNASENATLLPLLQVTLEEIWKKGKLILANYGNLTDAIKQRADQVYEFEDYDAPSPRQPRSDEAGTAIMGLFLNLVNVSLDDDYQRDVRVSRPKDDLVRGDKGAQLIDELARARLLSTSDESGVEKVNIIHESLINNWDRLREGVQEKRQQLQQRVRFEQQVKDWLVNGKSDDYLLSGVYLAQARELERVSDIALQSADARELLRRSETAEAAERERELKQAQTVAEAERERAQVARSRTMIVSVLLVLALIAAGLAGWQTIQAQQQQRLSRSREIAAVALSQLNRGKDPQRVLLFATEAVKAARTFEAEDALRQAMFAPVLYLYLRGHAGWVTSAAFSPDGKRIVTASNDGTALVYVVELDDLLKLAQSRVIRDLTCQERMQFLQEKLDCSKEDSTP